ncbi:hypothetical protein LDL59_05385 [Kaistella anthropi]|nr:hypothetical protein [Kaistella anthropi]
MTEYILKIEIPENKHEEITEILHISPSNTDFYWELSIGENNSLYTSAIDYFMNLIEINMQKLEAIGIKQENITIWFYKPYEGECSMEFSPKEMERLSFNNITLCISCWEI